MTKISSAEFLEMSHPVDTMRWQLPIVPKTTGGKGSLFGGAGLAAGIVALEQATGMPIRWATGQYLSLTKQPMMLDLEVILPAQGRHVTQGRAVCHLGEQEVITVLGAAGIRPSVAEGVWESMPPVPAPDDCPALVREDREDTIHRHVEIRIAHGMFGFSGDGKPSGGSGNKLWARMPEVEHDAGALAIIADYMPSALGDALGQIISCTSLDNTIRIANHKPSDWILCDNHISWTGEGFGYGQVNMWNEQGELMATASQSMIVRQP